MKHSKEEISTGIKAMQQWKEKRQQAGASIEDEGTAILGAIRNKWKVNFTQAESYKMQLVQKTRKEEKTKCNIEKAKDLIAKLKGNITCIIKLIDNIVWLKIGKGCHPLDLRDDSSLTILKRFIDEQLQVAL